MAIRKPQSSQQPEIEPLPAGGSWPYAIQERRLRVQSDGSLRIPATLARMFALEGEEVHIRLFSDGHIEIDHPTGRHGPPAAPRPGSRIFMSTEEFLEALENDAPDE
jgi:hypothetical protein